MNNNDSIINSRMIQDLILEFSGYELDLDKLSDYDRASMNYFTNQKVVRQPRLSITISLELTNAHHKFLDLAESRDTFTCYLTWGLHATICHHPYLSWRYIQGVWYVFDNLPLFIPVATGNAGNRLTFVLLEHISGINWKSFSKKYSTAIETALSVWSNPFIDQLRWSVYHFIGNLPGIQFTSLTIHESGFETSRPIFYLGHRYEDRGHLFVPFTVQFNHATFDPVLLDKFISDFCKLIS